jgi:hypothetical protein
VRERHFRDEEWADLVRIDGDRPRARMKQHLGGGCERCGHRLRFWTAVRRVSSREVAYAPPAAAVRRVREEYRLRGRSGSRSRSHATLLFDSAREAGVPGLRAGAPPARLLLYAKAGRLLKLRVESLGESGCLALVGQVVDEDAPQRRLADLPVTVQNGRKTVNETTTNQSGEFSLDLSPALQLRLVVGSPGPDAMMVILPVTVAVEEES